MLVQRFEPQGRRFKISIIIICLFLFVVVVFEQKMVNEKQNPNLSTDKLSTIVVVIILQFSSIKVLHKYRREMTQFIS